MSVISINVNTVNSLNVNVGNNVARVSEVNQRLSSLTYSVDSRVRARRNIGSRINGAYNSLQSVERNLKNLENFIQQSMNRYTAAERNINAKSVEMQTNSLAANLAWDKRISDFFSNSEISSIRDLFLEVPKNFLPIYYKIPSFRIDGRYVKVLNSDFYRGGQGLARRYTLENLKAGRYPKALKMYRLNQAVKGINVASKVAPWLSAGAEAYNELTTTEKISTERKISNAAISAGAAVGIGYGAGQVGMIIGGALGSVIPGPGTIIGAAVGAAVGVGIAYGVDKLIKGKFWGSGDNKKSTLDVVQDVVGDGVEIGTKAVGDAARGAAKWVGGLFGSG